MSEENNSPIDSTRLIDYAYGLLAPGEAYRVRLALEQDQELRWEYEGIVQLMKDHPGDDPAELFEEMVDHVDQKVNLLLSENKKKRNSIFGMQRLVVIAASVVVLIGFGFLVKHFYNQRNPLIIAKELVGENYIGPVDEERGERGEATVTWESDFEKGDYEAVIRDLAMLPDSSIGSKEAFFYGLSYLKTEPQQIRNAEVYLRRSTQMQGEHREEAWYYLGIVQLLKGNVPEAKKCLVRANNELANQLLRRLPE